MTEKPSAHSHFQNQWQIIHSIQKKGCRLNPEIDSIVSRQHTLSLCFKVFASALPCRSLSEEPSVSAMNPSQSEGAIKIPSCHKKPLRRVDVGRLLADMKRIPALLPALLADCFSVCTGLLASLKRVRQNCPADQEALSFYNLHFH